MSRPLPVFTCDPSVLPLPRGYNLANSRPYNKTKKRGWLLANESGACQCGKPYIKGHEILIAYGAVVGCAWCQTSKPLSSGDVAAWEKFKAEALALFPEVTDEEFDIEAMPREVLREVYEQIGQRTQFRRNFNRDNTDFRDLLARVGFALEGIKDLVLIEEVYAQYYRGAR